MFQLLSMFSIHLFTEHIFKQQLANRMIYHIIQILYKVQSQRMEGSNRSGLQCMEHPNEEVTNFCLHFDCLRPLCPDCVQVHTKCHQRQEIQSWKHCINKSSKNLKSTLDSLRSIYAHQNQYVNFKSVDTVEAENVKKLYQIKARLQKTFDDSFNNHQKQLRSLVRSQYRIDQPDTTKLRMAIEEIEKVLMKLGHSGSVLPALKKSLVLDYQSLLNYFGDMKTQQLRTTTNQIFVVETAVQNDLRALLEESVRLNYSPESGNNKKQQYKNGYNNSYIEQKQKFANVNIFQPLRITQGNYFRESCRNKLLHFFIPLSNQLKVLRIEQAESSDWKSLFFNANDILPCYFKSIITPDGQIYLTGGSDQTKRREIYKYNYQSNSLDFVTNMKYARSSHSICYLNNCIYLIGGFSINEGDITRDCEVLNLATKTCSTISPLNTPSANSCAVAFNQDIIFKLGGILNKYEGNSLIEMYSIKNNRWVVIEIEIPKNIPKLELLSFSAAVQINANQILVFGGYDNSQIEKPQRLCYVMQTNIKEGLITIKHFNTNPLPVAEAFWNNNPLVYRNHIYALQNITDKQDEQTALADERRVLVFNGERWM